MKFVAFVCALVIASGVAVPQPDVHNDLVHVVNEAPVIPSAVSDENLRLEARNVIADAASAVIERVSKALKDMGLDPLYITELNFDYALPVPSLFGVELKGVDIVVKGISDIVINSMSYSVLNSRLTFDMAFPEIVVDIGDSSIHAHALGLPVSTEYRGRITITNVGMAGSARAGLSISNGITIRDLVIQSTITNMNATIDKFMVQEKEYAQLLQTFINVDLFNAIKSHEDDISEMLEIIAWSIINRAL